MSGSWHNPKPLRPEATNGIFSLHEPEMVVKGLNAIERQRESDGSANDTRLRPSGVAPRELDLVLKGSYAEKLTGGRGTAPKSDPDSYNPDRVAKIIKSYLSGE